MEKKIQGTQRRDVKNIPELKKPRMIKEELKKWFNAEPGEIPAVFVGMKIKPIFITTRPNTKTINLSLQ